jgi:hypothetical protein
MSELLKDAFVRINLKCIIKCYSEIYPMEMRVLNSTVNALVLHSSSAAAT